jgi:hypothetical protein
VEFTEAVQQKSLPKPTTPPCPAHAQRTNPSPARSLRIVARGGDDGLLVADEKPKRRIMVRALELALPPVLETLRPVLPVVRERLLERGVERAGEGGGERLDSETLREHGINWGLVA